MPNTSGQDGVIIIGGVNMVTMEAAGNFAADPNSVPALLHALGLESLASLHYFEAVLETQAVDNAPQKARVLAARIIHARTK